MRLRFPVTSFVSDVISLTMEISEEEFDLLVKNCSEGIDIVDSIELADIYEQLLEGVSDDEEINESDYIFSYPEEVITKAEENRD